MKTLEEIFGAELVNVELFVKNSIRTICKNWNNRDINIGECTRGYKEVINGIEFACDDYTRRSNKHSLLNTRAKFIYIINDYKYNFTYYRNKLTLENQHCLDESAYKVVKTFFTDGQIIDDKYKIYIENGVKKVKDIYEDICLKGGGGFFYGGIMETVYTDECYDEENMVHNQYEYIVFSCPECGINWYSDGTKHVFY